MSQALGDADHAHFAGGIVRGVDKPLAALAGRGVDQAAVVLFDHIFGGFAAAQPDAGGVNRQHFFKVGLRHTIVIVDGDHPRVLDRDVDGAKTRRRLLVQRLHLRFIGDINLQRQDIGLIALA